MVGGRVVLLVMVLHSGGCSCSIDGRGCSSRSRVHHLAYLSIVVVRDSVGEFGLLVACGAHALVVVVVV